MSADAAVALVAAAHPGFCYHTAGVHPHDAAGFDAERDVPAIDEQLIWYGNSVTTMPCRPGRISLR